MKTLPTGCGKIKSVNCPLVDDLPRVLKSNGGKKQEERGGKYISEADKYLDRGSQYLQNSFLYSDKRVSNNPLMSSAKLKI